MNQLIASSKCINQKCCLNHKSKLSSNLLKLYKNGSSNDVKIILQDGEICANKDGYTILPKQVLCHDIQQYGLH